MAALFDTDTLVDTLVDDVERQVIADHGDPNADQVWREDPALLVDFVEGPDHLRLPPLYKRQYAAIRALVGDDPKQLFEEPSPAELKPLAWRSFRSTNVRRAAWAAEHGLLVEFNDRTVYAYKDAPRHAWQQLVSAPSKGKYLAAAVQPKYDTTRLEQPADELRERTAQRAAREHQIAVLLWGKGSGKDYVCSVVVAYLIHVLLCLRDPQGYFELAPGEPIDVLNVAYNAVQANTVFFVKFKERLYRWKWLREHYDVFEGGRRKWTENAGKPRVDISEGAIVFPSQIRCFSKHSQNESYEGMNVIAWVMDEASAFLSAAKKENAGAIYQTLRTSAGSRFQRRWVGFIISYPRHADDFTCQKVREARQNPDAGLYADGPAATWEINERLGRGDWVEVRPGHKVPVELANDYVLDFEEALAKYECLPPLAKDALIKEPQRVHAAVQKGREPLIEWEPIITRRQVVDGQGAETERTFAGVRLTRLGKLPRGTKLYMHGDPARTSDGYALAIGHGVPATVIAHVPAGEVLTRGQLDREGVDPEAMVPWERDVVRTVIDAVLVWRPDPKQNRHVDALNVRQVLQQLVEHYGRGAWGAITFDQYDSAETVQWLEARKLPVDNEQWTNQLQHRIYRGARSAFYNDLVTLPDTESITSEDASNPGMVYELCRVEEIDASKIDHPEGGSKDLADAVVRVIEHVSGESQRRFAFGAIKPGQTGHAGRVPLPPRPKTDPARTPSPATPQAKADDARRAAERPEGTVVEGQVGPSKFGFGSLRR